MLKKAWLGSRGYFEGVFELRNTSFAYALTLPGELERGSFVVSSNAVSLEFQHLNEQWNALEQVPREAAKPAKSHLTVAPQSTAMITAALVSRNVANEEGSRFRLLVRASDPDTCVASDPFRAIPHGPAVTGFKSIPKIPVFPLSKRCLASGHRQIDGYEVTKSTPISGECAAAAAAERDFLEATRHEVKAYLIFRIPHEPGWHFMIELGDEKNPGPDGGHFLAIVDPATGRTELTPGR